MFLVGKQHWWFVAGAGEGMGCSRRTSSLAHVKERLRKGMDMDSQSRQLERRFGPIFKSGRISPSLLFEAYFKVACEKWHGFGHLTLMIAADPQLDKIMASLNCLGAWSLAGMEPGLHTGSLQFWLCSSSLLLLFLLDPLLLAGLCFIPITPRYFCVANWTNLK